MKINSYSPYRRTQHGSVALFAIGTMLITLSLVIVMADSAMSTRLSSRHLIASNSLRLLTRSGLDYGYWCYTWQNVNLPYSETNRTMGPGTVSISLTDNSAALTDTYKVTATATIGADTYTATDVFSSLRLPNYVGGFPDVSRLQLNGGATQNGTRLRLTNAAVNSNGSAFFLYQVPVDKFNTTFYLQMTSAAGEGMTFCLQRESTTALKAGGTGLGYVGLTPSVAIKFDMKHAGASVSTTNIFTNGADPNTTPAQDNNLLPSIDLRSGKIIRVAMSYNGITLTVTLTDTVTNASLTQNYVINIPLVLGSSKAYVGFTAGVSPYYATQEIVNWVYTTN